MDLRSRYWIPSIIFLAGFALHLSLISKGPVTVDCLNLVIQSQATLATHQLHYLYGSGYPLMVLLGSAFIAFGKCIGITDPVLAVNFISVLFSSIAVLAFYLLVREICDPLTALLGSLVLLLNPISLDVSTYGINHAPALCFFLLGLLSLQRFKNKGNIQDLLLSASYFGFMGATRLQDLVLVLPAIVFMLMTGLKEGSAQNYKHKAHYFLLLMATVFLIIALFHWPYFMSDHANYDMQAKDFWKIGLIDNFKGLFSLSLIKNLLYIMKNFSIVGVVCIAAGFYYISRSSKRLLTFTLLWTAVPLFFYGNTMTSAPRFLNVLLAALIIPIGVFLARMLRHRSIPWSLIILISFFIIIFQPLLYTQQTFMRRHQHALISDYYNWVGRSTEPDATVISADDGLFIAYYSRRNSLEKPVSTGHLSPSELEDFKKKLDMILKERKPAYITAWSFITYDHYFEFRDFMRKNYLLTGVGQMPLELWYETPFKTQLNMFCLMRIFERVDQIRVHQSP